ncbi:MAG: hypothetical protein XD60_1070 [Acetothermia bacterium 64_32]|nr:MAG: hypothetical protein XD60_1070 [Acetothermia bacterium 64_32]HAF69932.1 hypothetical protein [Candidatus Acetothermia bacterium]
MRSSIFYPLSLLLVVLVAALSPAPPGLRAAAGALLLGLWTFGLVRGGRAVGYLPGHALLFLGLSLVGARAAAYAWLLVPPASVAFELSMAGGRRYLAAALYGILWLDLFACLHQLVAMGRGLSGAGLLAWSAGLGVGALLFVALGGLRLLRAERAGERTAKTKG